MTEKTQAPDPAQAPSDEHLMNFLAPWVIADDPKDRADFLAALRAALASQTPPAGRMPAGSARALIARLSAAVLGDDGDEIEAAMTAVSDALQRPWEARFALLGQCCETPDLLAELRKVEKLLQAISATDYPVSEELASLQAVIAKAGAIPAPEGAQELPPLPATDYRLFYEDEGDEDHGDEGYQEVLDEPGYTAKEMRDYARAAIRAALAAPAPQANFADGNSPCVLEWGAVSLPIGHESRITEMKLCPTLWDAIADGALCGFDWRVYPMADVVNRAAPAPQASVALAQEQWPPTPSAYRGDQYIGYSRTDLLKYAQEVLTAHGIPAPQTKEQP